VGANPLLTGDEGWGVTGRYVYAPIIDSDRVLHLGLRASYREPADNDALLKTLRIRNETTHFSNLVIVDTGRIENVESATLFGPEAAWVKGRFSLGGEYNDAKIKRTAGDTLEFRSWHVAATWTLTGESRASIYRIDAGEFKRLTPAQNFSRRDGGRGAWELVSRYASIDLNDGSFVGGSEKAFSAGANRYFNPNVRVLFDWTHILDTDRSNDIRAGAEGMNIFSMRAQYTF
jgi:phosphate-selective porin OprO/OprP